MQAILAEELDGAIVTMDNKLKNLLLTINDYKLVPVPKNLNACLRPYQERGFNWLIQNIHSAFGSILADDMGLGKTIQVIAVILYLKNHNFLIDHSKIIIIAPTSLLSNWQKEFEKFAPTIKVCLYHGYDRELLEDGEVIVTSYGLIKRDHLNLNKLSWFLMVIDEAQNIKNPYTEQAKAVKAINAKHKIAMSGTPIENRLIEYWSIFDFINHMYLGTLKQFRSKYAEPIEKERDKNSLELFNKITAPFILRRTKNDKTIITELPERIINNRYCVLTGEQVALYQNVVDLAMEKISSSIGIERKGLVLKMINSLKQICNHPNQFLKKQTNGSIAQSGKMLMLAEILAEIENIQEKALIFTQYKQMGNLLVDLLGTKKNFKIPFLHGGTTRIARDAMVADFQDPLSNTKIFIISLKAGGTGLNLTAANHVIHYDLWWNPAVENQATDRAYRIGQQRNVMVYRLITTCTFEERIVQMLDSKKELIDLTMNNKEFWITEMTTEQIKNLIYLKQ